MNRVLLFNKKKAPTRSELVSCERTMGELFFSNFDLKWAGYIAATGRSRLCANWIIPDNQVEAFHDFARSHTCEGYDLIVMAPGRTRFGGQCEVQVL